MIHIRYKGSAELGCRFPLSLKVSLREPQRESHHDNYRAAVWMRLFISAGCVGAGGAAGRRSIRVLFSGNSGVNSTDVTLRLLRL